MSCTSESTIQSCDIGQRIPYFGTMSFDHNTTSVQYLVEQFISGWTLS